MSVLETVTVDNVTYDMHDPKVGSGTLQTTAQTLIPAVNEVKSGLTTVSGKTDVIGSGALNTTSQTLIGAVNELASVVTTNSPKSYYNTYTGRLGSSSYQCPITLTTTRACIALLDATNSTGYTDSLYATFNGYAVAPKDISNMTSSSSGTHWKSSGGVTVSNDISHTRAALFLPANATYTFSITDAFIANDDTVHTLSITLL